MQTKTKATEGSEPTPTFGGSLSYVMVPRRPIGTNPVTIKETKRAVSAQKLANSEK